MSEPLETLKDLPSPYEPHRATGLLHLPRFIAKIRKHLANELPKSYQRNFCRGFDGFLCAHLDLEPQQLVDLVRMHGDDPEALEAALGALLPQDCKPAVWNRKVVQMGMSEMGREALEKAKASVGGAARADVICFCDVIDFDEGRL
ncbi:MAG: DUF5069 domain-containing protein [Opitutales bacterium]